MKLEKRPTKFQPVTIEITLETHREYCILKQMFGELSANEIARLANSNTLDGGYNNYTADEGLKVSKIYDLL